MEKKQHQSQVHTPIKPIGKYGHQPSPNNAIDKAKADLATQDGAPVNGVYLPQGQGSNGHGRRLIADITAHAGDNGHQHGQSRQLGNGWFKKTNNTRNNKGGD